MVGRQRHGGGRLPGLRAGGLDPGGMDGLFGPRATEYLVGATAEALRAAGESGDGRRECWGRSGLRRPARRGAIPTRQGAETNRDGAGVPAALRVPDARCGRRRVRLRVRGGPGDASRRVPAMRARGGPTATVGQETASARATGGAVRAPEREALRRPGRPAAVRDVRGRAATMTRRAPRTAFPRHPVVVTRALVGASSLQARGR